MYFSLFLIYFYLLNYFLKSCARALELRAWTHNPEIETWAEIKSWRLNWLSHPGTPGLFLIAEHLKVKNCRKLVFTGRNCVLSGWYNVVLVLVLTDQCICAAYCFKSKGKTHWTLWEFSWLCLPIFNELHCSNIFLDVLSLYITYFSLEIFFDIKGKGFYLC